MWPQSYQQRLAQWVDLRNRSRQLSLEDCLQKLNLWWSQTPWCAYYLHWDDFRNWPDPWQLLENDRYCGVARALGIVYTIMLIEHEEIHEVELVETASDNLVLVNGGKYILNWSQDDIVNISSNKIVVKRTADITQLQQKLG